MQLTNKPLIRLRPVIISPRTNRPMVEDILGSDNLRKLMRMVSRDKRLTQEEKFEVILRVLKRKSEIESGTKTLGDVAAYEADRLIKENIN